MSLNAAIEEPRSAPDTFRCGLALASVALFYTSLDIYAFVTYSTPPPIQWVVVFAACALALVLFDPRRQVPLLTSALGYWLFFFFCLTTAWGIFAERIPEVVQELNDRYRSIACLVVFCVIFAGARARLVAVWAVVGGIVLASALNVLEMASLVTFSDALERTPGRPAGLYFNPNNAALAIALAVAVVVEDIPRFWRLPLLLVGALGVSATFSRGAMICLLCTYAWLVWRRQLGTWSFALTSLAGFVLFVYAIGYVQSHDLLTQNTAARLALASDDSGRVELAMKALNVFLDHPLLGNGLATTATWDVDSMAHNLFLTLAADHGVLGMLAFPALAIALIMSRRGSVSFALVLMLAGLFSHDLLKDRYILLLIALSATPPVLVGSPRRGDLPIGEEVLDA